MDYYRIIRDLYIETDVNGAILYQGIDGVANVIGVTTLVKVALLISAQLQAEPGLSFRVPSRKKLHLAEE